MLAHVSAETKFREFIALSSVYNASDEIVEQTIELRRNYKIKIPDAIVAATAIVNKFILVTRNIADFKNIKGLDLFNPWEL